MHESTNSQLTAQRLLQEHGVMIDPEDNRTEVEVAMAFGYLPVEGAGVEISPDK